MVDTSIMCPEMLEADITLSIAVFLSIRFNMVSVSIPPVNLFACAIRSSQLYLRACIFRASNADGCSSAVVTTLFPLTEAATTRIACIINCDAVKPNTSEPFLALKMVRISALPCSSIFFNISAILLECSEQSGTKSTFLKTSSALINRSAPPALSKKMRLLPTKS